MEVRTVLFDAGNTLIELDYRAVAELFREDGVIFSPGEIREAAGRIRPEVDRWLAEESRSTESAHSRSRYLDLVLTRLGLTDAPLRERVAARVAKELGELWNIPAEGAHDTLEVLRARGIGIGVVSNSDGRIERYFRACGLFERVDTIVDSGVEGVEKPDPAVFELALGRLGARADTAVHVGDIPSVDAAGARAAGITPILIDPLDVFPDAEMARIRSLPELPPLLDSF